MSENTKPGVRSIPITVRGVRYASHGEAARALNVSPSTVSLASKRGRLETLGLGRGCMSREIARRRSRRAEDET